MTRLNEKQLNFLCCAKKFKLPLELTKIIYFTAFPTLETWREYLKFAHDPCGMRQRNSQFRPFDYFPDWPIKYEFYDPKDYPEIISEEDQYNECYQDQLSKPNGWAYELSKLTDSRSRVAVMNGLYPAYSNKKKYGHLITEFDTHQTGESYIDYCIPRICDIITNIVVQDNLPYEILRYDKTKYPSNNIIDLRASYDFIHYIRIHTTLKRPTVAMTGYYLNYRETNFIFPGPEKNQYIISLFGIRRLLSTDICNVSVIYSLTRKSLNLIA